MTIKEYIASRYGSVVPKNVQRIIPMLCNEVEEVDGEYIVYYADQYQSKDIERLPRCTKVLESLMNLA